LFFTVIILGYVVEVHGTYAPMPLLHHKPMGLSKG
jgi:hypothetical protein